MVVEVVVDMFTVDGFCINSKAMYKGDVFTGTKLQITKDSDIGNSTYVVSQKIWAFLILRPSSEIYSILLSPGDCDLILWTGLREARVTIFIFSVSFSLPKFFLIFFFFVKDNCIKYKLTYKLQASLKLV